MNTVDMEGFSLGEPALVCRWRIAGGALPLENRHLRALSQRKAAGRPVGAPLVAWVKQNVEWALKAGSAEHPDGVLLLIIDKQGRAAMTVGPYEPLAHTTASALIDRAADARREARATGVAPESLWVVSGSRLLVSEEAGRPLGGATSLIEHLSTTLGLEVERRKGLVNEALEGAVDISGGLFLASDEHGVVVASDASSPRAERLAGGYRRLLERSRRK